MIGRAIAAARDAAAEVVIVDSGSTDATLAIAEAAGARVFRQEWLGNGRQKRFAEDQCRNDFVLDLDADEIVTPDLAAEIRSLFAAGTPARSIYELKVVTVPPVGGQWPNFMVAHRRKLYNRRVVRAPDHKEWDQFDVPVGVPVGRLSGELLHHSYRDFAHIAEKLNRISTNRALKGRQSGRTVVALRVLFALPFYFIKHLVFRGLFRGGIYGFAIAGIAAHGRWLRDAKMYERLLVYRARKAEEKAAPDPVSNSQPERADSPHR